MTPQEGRCYRAIRDLTVKGVAPSFVELRDHLGLSAQSGVARLVESLERQGKVTREPGRVRSLRIVAGPYDLVNLHGLSSARLGELRDNALAILAQRKGRGE